MATKIRRSLFVGLGGTGMKALLHTKKMFMETYGEVPNMIGFLGIDTDGGEYNKELNSSKGVVRLEPSEQMQILVQQNPQPTYLRNPARFAWMPSENLNGLTNMSIGAGQIRSNGRFAITYNENMLVQKINTVINNIQNVQNAINGNYELLSTEAEIHMVFSVCGGTGAGTFINMAYLLREAAPNAKIYGYAVLPGIFDAMIHQPSAKAKIPSNAFGSLMDLDYLMHLRMDATPVNIDYLNRTYSTTTHPLDAVYLIDNKNGNNDVYTDTNDIAQMISLALVTSTGELSMAQQSVFDNVIKVIRDGNMDIEDKSAWAAGFGICEICYNGEELCNILKYKIVDRMVELLESPTEDANVIANSWIDDNHIRENNGKDEVIDLICTKNARIPFDAINTPANPQPEVDAYMTNLARVSPQEITGTIDSLKKSVRTALQSLLKKIINNKGGIGNCKNVINEITTQIELCLGEMRKELNDFQDKKPSLDGQVQTTCQELTDYMGKFFSRKKAQYIEAVIDAVNMCTTNLREIDRRNGAISFYTWLKQELSDAMTDVNKLIEIMNGIKEQCEKKVADIQYNINNNTNIFQIDLAKKEANKVTYDDSQIIISDFVNGISLPNQVYDFISLNSDAVFSHMLDYAERISEKSDYKNNSVDGILKGLSADELNNILREAVVKSEPLIQYNPRGYVQNYPPEKFFYVGVENKDTSVLAKNNLFAGMLTNRVPQFTSIGNKDKIIIYCQYGNMPLFTIDSVPTYEHRYNEVMRNSNCHFGVDLLARMQRENFSIYPKDTGSDTVELWVKGLIFGLIKNEGDKYVYRCESEGDIIDDYWVNLPQDRYEAFMEFKNHQNSIEKEYEEFFSRLLKNKGQEEIDKILADARENYEAKYAQLGLDKAVLKSRGYELVLKLYRQELEYVKKEL